VKEPLKKDSILILLGTGGVGKTTVAAALGVAGACARLNTVVITVDPARRLRQALGLKHLGGRPVRIARRRLAEAGIDPSLRLSAMMLDVKGAWDALVERFTTSSTSRRRILQNPFYRSLTEQFAGSEAFAALQQLYDLHQSRNFEFEIVDTPPAAHAFDFLHAPARLLRLLDSRATRWLFAPSISAGQLGVRLASRAARFVIYELERFAGGDVLSTIAEFFAAASETVDAVGDRLRKTERLLRSPATHFVLVTTADEDRLRRARELIGEMEGQKLRLAAVVINRFLDQQTWQEILGSRRGRLGHLEEIRRLYAAAADAHLKESAGAEALLDYFEDYRRRTVEDVERVARFVGEVGASVKLVILPEIEAGVSDLRSLQTVAHFATDTSDTLSELKRAASTLSSWHRHPSTRRATS